MEAAKLLKRKFGIPYVVGMPIGNEIDVVEALEKTLKDKEDRVISDDGKEGDNNGTHCQNNETNIN